MNVWSTSTFHLHSWRTPSASERDWHRHIWIRNNQRQLNSVTAMCISFMPKFGEINKISHNNTVFVCVVKLLMRIKVQMLIILNTMREKRLSSANTTVVVLCDIYQWIITKNNCHITTTTHDTQLWFKTWSRAVQQNWMCWTGDEKSTSTNCHTCHVTLNCHTCVTEMSHVWQQD